MSHDSPPAVSAAVNAPWPGWHRLHLSLRCERTPPPRSRLREPDLGDSGDELTQRDDQTTSLAVFHGLWKFVASKCQGLVPMAFRPQNYLPLPLDLRAGRVYALTLVFQETDATRLQAWAEALSARLADPDNNFTLLSITNPEWMTWESLQAAPHGLDMTSDEVCLDFLTPFSFQPPTKERNWELTELELRRRAANRWQHLHGTPLDHLQLPPLRVLPYFWDFVHREREAKSQPGRQFFTGCSGPLYLRGLWQKWLPLLLWLQEWGLGEQVINGQGSFHLATHRTHFDRELADPARFIAALEAMREENDDSDHPLMSLLDDVPGVCQRIAAEVKSRSYQAETATGFHQPKKDGVHTRVLAESAPRDSVVTVVLKELLQRPLDNMFEESSHGSRPQRGTQAASAAVKKYLKEGCTHVLESDIATFFDAMDWDVLDHTLDQALPRADVNTRAALRTLIRAPLTVNGHPQERNRGVLQGWALSSLLANLYLDTFDEQLAARGHRLVRYVDDFLILGMSEWDCRRALDDVREILRPLRLELKSEKTSIRPVDLGLIFLGESLGPDTEDPLVERNVLQHPVWIINDWSRVGLEQDNVVVRRQGRKTDQFPLRRVREIIVQGTHSVSSSLLMGCAARGIPVSFSQGHGRFITVMRAENSAAHEKLYLHGSRHAGMKEEDRLENCRLLVAAKVLNYLAWLTQKRVPPPVQAAHFLRKLRQSTSVAEVMGYEGDASRSLFKAVNKLVKTEAFISHAREQRKKRDRWNVLLDFAYSLLFHHLHVQVRSAGLNPFLGFLHTERVRYESLVCDLQEPFRQCVDRMLLGWVNRRVVQADDFEQTADGRWQFRAGVVGRLLNAWERQLRSGTGVASVSLRQTMSAQVRWMENWVRHGGALRVHRTGSVPEAVDGWSERVDAGQKDQEKTVSDAGLC